MYNGEDRKIPDRIEMKLSDSFEHPDNSGNFEWTATLININYGMNEKIMKACRMLEEYSMCIAEIRNELKETTDAETSITKAVDTCIKTGILRDFLITHKAEVIGMFLTEYNEEEARKRMREESYEEGRAEGLEEGRAEGLEKGVDKSIRALAWLQQQNRTEDMLKAINDKEYMTQVMREYEESQK